VWRQQAEATKNQEEEKGRKSNTAAETITKYWYEPTRRSMDTTRREEGPAGAVASIKLAY
jgi:hypothetical protein